MVKTYSLKKDGNTNLSPHFKVKEFRCKDGTDKILIDDKLVEKLEEIRSELNAKALVIYSGYRTPAHDKKVGGSGSGQHTKGKAVDCYLVGQDGKRISAKLVCATAGDLGFNGIGYIGSTSLHLDVASRKWWGDETVSVNYGIERINGSKTFWEYFKLDKPKKEEPVEEVETPVEEDKEEKPVEIQEPDLIENKEKTWKDYLIGLLQKIIEYIKEL